MTSRSDADPAARPPAAEGADLKLKQIKKRMWVAERGDYDDVEELLYLVQVDMPFLVEMVQAAEGGVLDALIVEHAHICSSCCDQHCERANALWERSEELLAQTRRTPPRDGMAGAERADEEMLTALGVANREIYGSTAPGFATGFIQGWRAARPAPPRVLLLEGLLREAQEQVHDEYCSGEAGGKHCLCGKYLAALESPVARATDGAG